MTRLDPTELGAGQPWAERVDTPALVVSRPNLLHNLSRIRAELGGELERWRPHVKTVKIPEVLEELVAFGVRNFKCATTREAHWVLEALSRGGDLRGDLLYAYPPTPPALARLSELAERHPGTAISVLVESPGCASALPDSLGAYVDVNPGMNRTGVPLRRRDDLLRVAAGCGTRFRGLHCYEGHLSDTEAATAAPARRLYEELHRLLLEFRTAGLAVGELVTSGTPTFRHALGFASFVSRETVHRVSPGTVVFGDGRTAEQLPKLDLRPAAVVLSRVVSRPSSGIATCDAGSKAIAVDAGDPCASVLGRPGLRALQPSEEHLPLEILGEPAPRRNDLLFLAPRHVCPTVNLAEKAVWLNGEEAPRVVEVRGRAPRFGAQKLSPATCRLLMQILTRMLGNRRAKTSTM